MGRDRVGWGVLTDEAPVLTAGTPDPLLKEGGRGEERGRGGKMVGLELGNELGSE